MSQSVQQSNTTLPLTLLSREDINQLRKPCQAYLFPEQSKTESAGILTWATPEFLIYCVL